MMRSRRGLWPFGALHCNCTTSCDTEQSVEDVQVQLLSSECSMPHAATKLRGGQQNLLTEGDSFDITFTPRSTEKEEDLVRKASPMTPRQREIRGQLELPQLELYPAPPEGAGEREEDQRQRLLETYQAFALELHRGMYLTQLMADRSYSDIHCQLMEDMATLKLDQSNGRIIEFPLANVSQVYRLTKSGGKWYPTEKQGAGLGSDQIIVVVFSKRKLAFVFKELNACNRFMLCLELLIWRAQQLEGVPLLRSSCTEQLSATGQQAGRGSGGQAVPPSSRDAACATPRLVRSSELPPQSRPQPHRGIWRDVEECPRAEEDSGGDGGVEGTGGGAQDHESLPVGSPRPLGPRAAQGPPELASGFWSRASPSPRFWPAAQEPHGATLNRVHMGDGAVSREVTEVLSKDGTNSEVVSFVRAPRESSEDAKSI